MSSEDARPDQGNEIPEDALVIRQVQWAWVYSSAPWLAVLLVLMVSPIGLDEFSALFVAIIIMVPRYLGWRRTAYVLTDDTLIYQRGGFTGSQRYEIALSRLKNVRIRYGFFGRSLGYKAVDILLDDNAIAPLTYVPSLSDLGDRLQEAIGPSASGPEDAQDTDGPSEDPGKQDPEEPA